MVSTSPIKFYKTTKGAVTAPLAHSTPLLSELMAYVKTTETCQLNCDHCFTNGTNGKKIYFDPVKTIDWFHRLHEVCPTLNGGSIAFHGGEPMLAPVADLRKTWAACKDLWPNVWWTITTNLVFNLDDEKRAFFKEAFTDGISTSWDKDIRFANEKQEELWTKNVKTLIEDGHKVTLMISLSKSVIDMPILELLQWVKSLGVQYLHLERITPSGNAVRNPDIMPSNAELDQWFVELWDAILKLETYKHFDTLFINGILSSIVSNAHSGCRCRSCEKKIFTINADGTIGGCPNSAVDNTFATISDDIVSMINSEGRRNNIVCESQRNPLCYTCDVYDVCNGDCHQLAWEGDVCASPKTLMAQLKKDGNVALYRDILNGYIGAE